PDMLARPAFASREARIAHYEDVVAFLAPIFASRPRDAWCAALNAGEVPHAPVATSAEVLASPQAQALGLCVEDPAGPHGVFRTIRSPLSFDGERMTQVTAPPTIGQHDNEIKRAIS
ncbi:MAG: CoA transferase, partial [Sphingomonas sp.]